MIYASFFIAKIASFGDPFGNEGNFKLLREFRYKLTLFISSICCFDYLYFKNDEILIWDITAVIIKWKDKKLSQNLLSICESK